MSQGQCGYALQCPSVHESRQRERTKRGSKRSSTASGVVAILALAASLPGSSAQANCVSLQGSSACPAFSAASISTNLTGDFSFLSFVSDVQSFDNQLRSYISTTYTQRQYQNILGCSDVDLSNTTDLYARYTTTVLCNAIVQNSREPCGLSESSSTPLCATACADFATSEQEVVSTPQLCGTPGSNANSQIRADFTRCSLPANALSGSCIEAARNEPDECGYGSNLQGLCSYCAESMVNSTSSCCVNSKVESRCAGVELPTTVSMPPLFPTSSSTSSPTASSGAATGGSQSGLSGGAIAGIVVGAIIGAGLLLAALIFFCLRLRRRRDSQAGSILNTPSPSRHSAKAPPMSYGGDGQLPPAIVPGARVQRMSALEGSSSSGHSERGMAMTAFGGSQNAYDSPDSRHHRFAGAAALPKRQGSLSSRSALESSTDSPYSNSDGRNFSSPDGVASGQSEQLQFFKDYYSQDDIHPNDTVATLWAYQPRAGDEFELERGDMLKVVGIWDDGWATGVRLAESAEEWEARKAEQRDSGVSNGTRRSQTEISSDIKAFPLVCVCLPEHWRKTIEGDSTDSGHGPGVLPPSTSQSFPSSTPKVSTPPDRVKTASGRFGGSEALGLKSSEARRKPSIPRSSYTRTPGMKSSCSSTLIDTSPEKH